MEGIWVSSNYDRETSALRSYIEAIQEVTVGMYLAEIHDLADWAAGIIYS